MLSKDLDVAEGRIMAIGEPTAALYEGQVYVYFVYGYVRGFDPRTDFPDIDLNAGFVPLQ